MVLFSTQNLGNVNHLLLFHTGFNLVSKNKIIFFWQCVFFVFVNSDVIFGHRVTKVGIAIKVNEICLLFKLNLKNIFVKQKENHENLLLSVFPPVPFINMPK